MALFWQLYEILRHKESSNQIKIIRYLIVGEIFFILLRIFAIVGVDVRIIHVEDLPVLGLFAVWMMYALKIIVYGGMVAYWTEQMGMEKAKIEYEAWQFKELNQKQAALIADLGRLNKTATAGVMAASIAHELSQPLQSLTLHVGLCKDELQSPQPDHQLLNDTLNEQTQSVNRMTEVIHTMRGMFTDSEKGDEEVDLFELIQRLAIFMNPQAKKLGVEMDYVQEGSTRVVASPAELQQVILNLVANAFDALKCSDMTSKKIRITVQGDSDRVRCHVEDSGVGIPDDQQDSVFKFLKTNKTTGMGLGLWLSKYIVERNHGEIFLQTSALGGALFTLQFPAPARNLQPDGPVSGAAAV